MAIAIKDGDMQIWSDDQDAKIEDARILLEIMKEDWLKGISLSDTLVFELDDVTYRIKHIALN